VAPDVAGYVQPSEIFYKISTSDLSMLEELMNVTLWGSSATPQTKGLAAEGTDSKKPETATKEILDIKPQADRLKTLSEMFERRHKFILDFVVALNLQIGYKGSTVNYGRRYMIEGPDELLDKYNTARTIGAPITILDSMLKQYIEAEHAEDPVELEIQLKLIEIEPFVHIDADKIDAAVSVTPEDKARKRYFSEWKSSVNEAMFLSMSVELLRENFTAYVQTKQAEIDKQKEDEHAKNIELKNQNKPAFGA
jgi:hypothetical protein